MALATVLLYLVVIYVRPGEVIEGWEGFPFAAIVQAVSAIAVALSLAVRPRSFWNQPHDRYVAGFFAASLLSNVAWGWFGGAYRTLLDVGPQVVCYFLLRGAIRSARDLRWVGYTLVAATLFQAVVGIAQFQSGVGLGGVSVIETHTDADAQADDQADEDPGAVRRIRGTGIFNDPNDLAMAFVVAVPFLLGPIVRRRSPLPARALASASLVPILTALYYTNSRGGVLGLGAVLVLYCWRVGKAAGTLIAVVGLTALIALGPSRMSELDSEDSSAQGRVQSWAAGLQMLKSHPVLGVGYLRYTEFNDLVAHNSFVHTLGELGSVGAFFFTGMIYWLFRGTPRVLHPAQRDPELAGLSAWGDDLRCGSFGLCVCAMFLSRQYSSLLFNSVALSACYRQILQDADPTMKPEGISDLAAVGAATVGGVVIVYVLVRVLALWGG